MRATGNGVILLLFALLYAAPAWVQADVKDRMVERRAIEPAVWGMPIVNFQAMRDGLKKDAGVGFNDVAYNSKVQTWRLRTTTNNSFLASRSPAFRQRVES
jgi:hypothetical protein